MRKSFFDYFARQNSRLETTLTSVDFNHDANMSTNLIEFEQLEWTRS